MNIIHAWIYDPTRPQLFKPSANERSALFTLHCDRAADCDVYRSGSCLLTAAMKPCKYGQKRKRSGYTKRAGKFSRQILDWQKEYADHLKKLKPLEAYNRVFRVADHWYLPYSHMTKGVWGRKFPLENEWVPVSEMNADLMDRILTARPEAEFGGELKGYQGEQIPKFLADMKANYPELWRLVSDEQKSRLADADYVGRKAVLATCLPGKFGKWVWDGEVLSGTESSLMPVKGNIAITPQDGAGIKVTDNSTVGPNTRFLD